MKTGRGVVWEAIAIKLPLVHPHPGTWENWGLGHHWRSSMRVATLVITFGVHFLRNVLLLLQSNMKNPHVTGTGTLTPLWCVSLWISALVTTDPRGGLSGTLSGPGGCSEGTVGRAVSWGLHTTTCNFFPLLWSSCS